MEFEQVKYAVILLVVLVIVYTIVLPLFMNVEHMDNTYVQDVYEQPMTIEQTLEVQAPAETDYREDNYNPVYLGEPVSEGEYVKYDEPDTFNNYSYNM